MNIFRDRGLKAALRIGVTAALLLFGAAPSWGLDGNRTVAQYVHDSWGPEQGFIGGTVYAIAESHDGYLWFGTERGLVRFDGFEFKLIQTPLPGYGPIGAVRGLVADTEGNLWIRLDGPRLLRYRDGVFEDAVRRFDIPDAAFTAIAQGDRGEALLWGPRNRTLRFQNGQFMRVVPRDGIAGIVISTLETAAGTLWLGARDAGLYKVANGKFGKVLSEGVVHSVNALASAEHGGVWIGSEIGLKLWVNGGLASLNLPRSLEKAQIFALTEDEDHNLWVGTDRGLYRIDSERRVVTGSLPSTNGTEISAVYEDKEGDIWFAGARGVERLRDGMFTSMPVRVREQKENGGPIFVDEAGRTWFAPLTGGLFYTEKSEIRAVDVAGLGHDVIYSIAGGGGEVWVGRQRGGLTELTSHGDGWLARTYTREDGLAENSVYTVTRASDGSVWAGTVSGGVSVLRHGRFKTYTVDNGLQSNAIFSSMQAADGKMWFASPSGLVCFDGEHWSTYGATDTQPPPNVRTEFEDSGHVLWVGTSHGLAYFDHGQVKQPPALPPLLTDEVLGISQDPQGFLWLVTAQHILQVDRARLLSGSLTDHDVLTYGTEDGLLETTGVRRDHSMAVDTLGRIWLSLQHSIAVVDVRAARGYRSPVDVRIDSVVAANTSSAPQQLRRLPPETRSVTFLYSGTSLSMPQRTQFRYRLDGSDLTWSEDTSLRQVVYTHLVPGNYTFRIIASDALGAWTGPETDYAFSIQPALWQTWYFRVLIFFALALLVVVLYRIRLLRLTEQLNRRFQDRLAERTRIAQDLHDTLLQGVLSASMQLDIAQDRLPDDSPTKPMLQRVLQLMSQVTEEGRAALRGLRTVDTSMSLEAALSRLGEEFVLEHSLAYRVHTEGDARPLRAAVREEAYHIGREAAINAAAHARANVLEVVLKYSAHEFSLMVRDDGCGISETILRNGREGHWGLAGMRERARSIRSVLNICNRVPNGTDVALIVPAVIAFDDGRRQRRWWPFRRRVS